MIEAIMLWNEPNNLSHWDFEMDRDWSAYARMVKLAASAIQAENPNLTKVLGGISPIDPAFIVLMQDMRALEQLDAVAVHGFPLDWNHWTIHEWPDKLAEIQAVTMKPIWVSEVGASSFGAEEVQALYSLFDLPRAWPATTRHRESEGSSYYRHFYMGLFREDGTPKLALRDFSKYAPALGICQWFHFEDHRLETAVQALRDLGVKKLRTGLSWADFERPNAEQWFDRQMRLLESFDLTVTFCFTPERCGVRPHHTSPPQNPEEYAEFCAAMTRRYGL